MNLIPYEGRQVMSMAIAKLIITVTGTYNPMMNRPYTTNLDGRTAESLAERVAEVPGVSISSKLFAGKTAGVIEPSANHYGEVYIPNGWSERRCRFVLEVQSTLSNGTVLVHYFQGYTSYPGIDNYGNIAPDMEFIINGITGVSRTMRHTPLGMVPHEILTESFQCLTDNDFNNTKDNPLYTIRPTDVYNGISTMYINRSLPDYGEGPLLDTRIRNKAETVRSNRSNNIGTNWLSNVVSSYVQANNVADFCSGDGDVFSQAAQYCHEDPITDNPFIVAISGANGYRTTNRFNTSALSNIDPSWVSRKHVLAPSADQMRTLSAAGQTEYWTGGDRPTQVAAMLSQAIPAIMSECLLSNVAFVASNMHSINGVPEVKFVRDPKSIISADMRNMFNKFLTIISGDLLFDISYGFNEPFDIFIDADIYNDTILDISISGYGRVVFSVPTFCDNLFAPTICNAQNVFEDVVAGVETLARYTGQAINAVSPVAVNNIV